MSNRTTSEVIKTTKKGSDRPIKPPKYKKYVCEGCGLEVSVKDNFCNNCGKKFIS